MVREVRNIRHVFDKDLMVNKVPNIRVLTKLCTALTISIAAAAPAQLDAITDKLKVTTDAVTNAIKHLITLINLLGEGRVPNGLPLRKNAAKKE